VLETSVLKGVSRSFYLSLRLLPAPMRGAASLAYLLARASDTIADTERIPTRDRVAALGSFAAAVRQQQSIWSAPFLAEIPDPRERRLLEHTGFLLQWLDQLPESEAVLVREVVDIIIGGQKLDLERFEHADEAAPVALIDGAALEDYAWRVAGCVGAFWTKLGFLTMGDGYSTMPADQLLERGVAYGKALQLVNILRDVPGDMAAGRCYLPVTDPRDRSEVMAAHGQWLDRARVWTAEGVSYASSLSSRRLRAATILPALLAGETLELLSAATWEDLQRCIKVPRRRVYRLLLKALTA
jgi:farnesyl-diphosphate farnesyltransferase